MRNLATVITAERKTIEAASMVMYKISEKELSFWILEGCALRCSFERAVSGDIAQLIEYYRSALKAMFPHKMIRVKP